MANGMTTLLVFNGISVLAKEKGRHMPTVDLSASLSEVFCFLWTRNSNIGQLFY